MSEKKRLANRRNSLRSTGPRTPSGKATSSKNALSHGLLSRDILLPNEDGAALDSLRQGLRDELSPTGQFETILVDKIVSTLWRLGRLHRVEADVFRADIYETEVAASSAEAASYVRTGLEDSLEQFRLVDERLTDEQRHHDALEKADVASSKRSAAILGRIFSKKAAESDAFSKLSRYETALERSLFRTLHELQRLQAARAGQPVQPPVAVDVDVSGP